MRHRRTASSVAALSLGVALLTLPWCCNRPARDLAASANPVDRARAAVQLGESHDPAAIPVLVGLLEDPDRGVRMYAILALRRSCGEDFGYRYYAPEPKRAAAVDRWRQAVADGRIPRSAAFAARPPNPAQMNADVPSTAQAPGGPP